MTASIPVDLLNPGQVFACLGFVELSELLLGETHAAFDWRNPAQVKFVIEAAGDADPIQAALDYLASAQARAFAPYGSGLRVSSRHGATDVVQEGDPFPTPEPPSPATLPAVLHGHDLRVSVYSWGEARLPKKLTARRDNVKFWAGAGGYPGVALLRDALHLVRDKLPGAREAPFDLAAPQSSSFGFDWRRDYIPIDIGFSLNNHKRTMKPRGYPLVELLALIGMSHARPERITKLDYRYSVCGVGESSPEPIEAHMLPAVLLRASLGSRDLPFPTRTFRMRLDWPGQANRARCITSAYEESY